MTEIRTIIDQYSAFDKYAVIDSKNIPPYTFNQVTPLGKYYYNVMASYITLNYNSAFKLKICFVSTSPDYESMENVERLINPQDIEDMWHYLKFLGYTRMQIGNKEVLEHIQRGGFRYYLFNNYEFISNKYNYFDFSKMLKYSPYFKTNNDYVLEEDGQKFTIYYDVAKLYNPNIFKIDFVRATRDNGVYSSSDYWWIVDFENIVFPHDLKKEHLKDKTVTHLQLLKNDYPEVHPDNISPNVIAIWLNINSFFFIKDNYIYIYFLKDWISYPNAYGWRYADLEYYEYIIPFGELCCLAKCFVITK